MKHSYARWVVIVLLALSIAAGAATGAQLYYRLAYLWAFILAVSWLTSFLSLRGTVFRRTVRSLRAQVGEVFEERFEIQNTGRMPRLWMEVQDESHLPGAGTPQVFTMIGGHEGRSFTSRTRLQERGVFRLGPTVLTSGDIFGLFPAARTIPAEDELLIYPKLYDVQSFPNPPGLLPGGEALRRRTPQITSNAAGVREYTPGDPLNRIHWASTARRNRLIVKEFELDPLAEVWLYLDASRHTQAARPYQVEQFNLQNFWRQRSKYELPPSTLEYAVSITGSLAKFYLQRGRAVGLVMAGQSLQVLAADRGGRQLGKMLEALSLLQAQGDLPLHGLVEAQGRHLPRGSTAVLVTASDAPSVYKMADLLLRRGLRPILVQIDATTFGGKGSPQELVRQVGFLGIPVCSIAYGDDLALKLSTTVSQPYL